MKKIRFIFNTVLPLTLIISYSLHFLESSAFSGHSELVSGFDLIFAPLGFIHIILLGLMLIQIIYSFLDLKGIKNIKIKKGLYYFSSTFILVYSFFSIWFPVLQVVFMQKLSIGISYPQLP